ncbi:hypothetical protein AB0M20_27010 [Actinoplanes sp. NPDC051633]|uniref:hypothetical protein n=1 Tax=Actinoplanes sp. NPDC051633 TaxID=3155670 RepID=UPI0034434255
MTTAPTAKDDPAAPASIEEFRALLAPNLDHPADYWRQLAFLLSLYFGVLQSRHRRCAVSGCRVCEVLADVVALAQAHNSLQTFDEGKEIDLPYPLLSTITSSRGLNPNPGPAADRTATDA